MTRLLWVFTLFIAAALCLPPPFRQMGDDSAPTVVDPSSGVVYIGNLTSNVEQFLNIRYGQDTSGSNRFAAPKPFTYPSNFVVNASVNGAACPQPVQSMSGSSPMFENVTYQSEDCLTLRIARPQNTSSSDRLPVFVYMYGGGYSAGQAYDTMYCPIGLVQTSKENAKPVIYVSMNYRIGFFGFAASEAIRDNDSLNNGLRDQRLALHWIQDNIHLFGGDPDSVTIAGQSAGGISVGLQILAYGGTEPAPFVRGILDSGAPTSITATNNTVAFNRTDDLAQQMNCTSEDSNEQLECLRALPFITLRDAVVDYEMETNPLGGYTVFTPVSPSTFIPDAPSALLRDGRFAKNISVITGWTENDGSLFTATTVDSQEAIMESLLLPAPNKLSAESLDELFFLYPISSFNTSTDNSSSVSPYWYQASQMHRDMTLTCPLLFFASAVSNQSTSSSPANAHIFTLNQTILASMYEEDNKTFLGVSHFSDIPYVFDAMTDFVENPSKSDMVLGQQISRSWSLFAAMGEVSDGSTTTVIDWSPGFADGAATTDKNTAKTEMRSVNKRVVSRSQNSVCNVRIIGGPNAGMTEAWNSDSGESGHGILAPQDLGRRCAFWNSERLQREMSV